MQVTLIVILLSIIWLIFTGDFSLTNFIFGNLVGYLIMLLLSKALGNNSYFKTIPKIISLIVFFVIELVRANFKVAYEIMTVYKHNMEPGIVKVPLDIHTDFQITLFANLITLTPGTLSMGVSFDKKYLYVHSMYYMNDKEKFIRDIKNGFEKKIIEAFG